jgi:putative phosphoesterase
MKIGVISDTHNFLDPRITKLFEGVDHILHGGDVGNYSIITGLERIAPVTAVLGNTDDPGFGYRLTEQVTLEERRFLIHHIVNPNSLTDEFRQKLRVAKPDVVVFGHTHKPFAEVMGGILFFNPGYAGKPRFDYVRSVALLHLNGEGIRHEYLPLG